MAYQELTPEQKEAAVRLANGLTLDEIAAELFLSKAAIRYRLNAAKLKIGARTTPHLAAMVALRELQANAKAI